MEITTKSLTSRDDFHLTLGKTETKQYVIVVSNIGFETSGYHNCIVILVDRLFSSDSPFYEVSPSQSECFICGAFDRTNWLANFGHISGTPPDNVREIKSRHICDDCMKRLSSATWNAIHTEFYGEVTAAEL